MMFMVINGSVNYCSVMVDHLVFVLIWALYELLSYGNSRDNIT